MAASTAQAPALPDAIPGIRVRDQWWVLIALGVLLAAILAGSFWFLNFVHVFFAILWTGTDLFMGFVFGPVQRQVEFPARRAFITRLMPRMLFYMPTVAIITSTSGWFLMQQMGLLALPFPQRWWLVAAGVLVLVMTIQGFGILLPTNLRVYFEMRKPQPDGPKIGRWMQRYVRVVAIQGVLQLATILVMARLATGV